MYHMILRFHLSVNLFLGLCLGNWRNHCSERWVRVSFSVAVFRDISRGVGTRIPSLALLRCFALACGCCQCVFTGNVKGEFHHLAALSSMHCLQTVRMAILTVRCPMGFDFLLISCCRFDRHHSYNDSGWWTSCLWLFGFFFSFLKGYEENWPLKLISWKSIVFGIYL